MDNKESAHEGAKFEIDNANTKWQAQEVGVNSNVPLVDAGTGSKFIIRRFEFEFHPRFIRDLKEGKTKLHKQDLFNSNWRQIEITLWGDGLIPRKDIEPRILIFKKHYQIILLCEPRTGVLVMEKARTLQDLTKPKPQKLTK